MREMEPFAYDGREPSEDELWEMARDAWLAEFGNLDYTPDEDTGYATAEEEASAASENDSWETYKALREVHAAAMAIDAWPEVV